MTQSLEVLPGCDLWAIKASLGMCVLEKSRGTGVGQLGRAGDPEVEGGHRTLAVSAGQGERA